MELIIQMCDETEMKKKEKELKRKRKAAMIENGEDED